ncbi:MAG: c-type cytochrome domain-containing protein, partial [Bryobacteraceae bacterium]
MRRLCAFTALSMLLAVVPLGAASAPAVSYSRQVAPLLEEKCGACHSPDARTSGFDISSVESLRKGGKKAGPAVLPGDPAKSPLIQYVSGLRQPRMPNGMAPLAASDIEIIRNWIAAGAKDDTPPASAKFLTPKPQADSNLLNDALFADAAQMLVLRRKVRLQYVPKPSDPPADASLTNPLDRFIVAKWKQAGLP